MSDNKTGIIRLIAYYPFQIAKKLVLLPSSSRRDGWMDGRWNLKKKQKRDGDQLADRGRNRRRRRATVGPEREQVLARGKGTMFLPLPRVEGSPILT